MSQFVAPASVRAQTENVCSATIDGKIRCELGPHDGHTHRNGPLLWHEPPLVIIDGREPDLDTETEHWQGGQVRLSWQEPVL